MWRWQRCTAGGSDSLSSVIRRGLMVNKQLREERCRRWYVGAEAPEGRSA